MAQPVSPWPGYPDIPIFLDTRSEYHRSTVTTLDTSKSVSPVSPLQAPHCITITPPKGHASHTLQIPNSESLKNQPQSERSPVRHLSPVEYPSVNKLSESWTTRISKTRSPKTTPRSARGPNSISQFRFGDFPSAHKSGYTLLSSEGKTPSGLGIMDGSTYAASSPPPPPVPEKDWKAGSSPNIAQRIEDRLWQYSIHGNTFKKWLLEIISWTISAVCMGAILVILVLLKDRKLSDWPFGPISLNAVVATLSRISSAALLLPVSEALGQLKWSWFFQGTSKKMWDFEIFDNASRGPWGSLQLLVRTKGRKLAALGAAIVLLTLALDPFFQQVLEFPDRWWQSGTSSIPQVFRYAPNYTATLVGGKIQSFSDRMFAGVTEPFFYDNGTQPQPLGNGFRPEIPITCPTNNCTWPLYQTLGFCSACQDVSDQLQFRCMDTRIDWLSSLNSTLDESIYPNGTVCGYFLDTGKALPILMSGYLVRPDDEAADEVLVTRTLPLITLRTREPLFGGSIHFKDHRNPIADVIIVSARDGAGSVYRNETPAALECVLSWCVKTLESKYFEGKYDEEVVETFINKTSGPYPWVTSQTERNTTTTTYLQNITINPSESQIDPSVIGSNVSDYGLLSSPALATIFVFDDVFPSFVTVANGSSTQTIRRSLLTRGLPRTQVLTFNPWTPANNISGHLERMATAMTNVLRSTTNAQDVPGLAFFEERFVAVRWEWLSLPLGLLIFTFIFLVATIRRTSQDHVGVWKTSAIATLLYGLPDEMQKKMASLKGTPRAQAKELKVKILPKMGWRVSGNLFSPLTPKVKPNQPPPGWI